MCAPRLSKERRCLRRARGDGSGVRGAPDPCARWPARARIARAGTPLRNTPSSALPCTLPAAARPAGSSTGRGWASAAAPPGPGRQPERFGRRERRTAAPRTRAKPNAMRDDNGTPSASRRATPSATSPNDRRVSPRAHRPVSASVSATAARRQSAPRRPGQHEFEQRDRTAGRPFPRLRRRLDESPDGRGGQLEPAVRPVAGVQRALEEQPVEVRDVPPNGRIEQVALVRPGGAGQRQLRSDMIRSPYMVQMDHIWI